jgi:RNase P subunit RPR2
MWSEVKDYMILTFDEKGVRMHMCAKCRFSARNTSNLRSHIEANHMEGRTYTCRVCGEVKKTWQTMLTHCRSQHGLRNFNKH